MDLRPYSSPLSRHPSREKLVRSGAAAQLQQQRTLDAVRISMPPPGSFSVESYEQLAEEFQLAVSLGRLDPTDRDRMGKDLAALGREVAEQTASNPTDGRGGSPVFSPVGSAAKATRRRPPTPETVAYSAGNALPAYMQGTTSSRTKREMKPSHSWHALVTPSIDKKTASPSSPQKNTQRPASAAANASPPADTQAATPGAVKPPFAQSASAERQRPRSASVKWASPAAAASSGVPALLKSFDEQKEQGRIRYSSTPPIPTQTRRNRPESAPRSRSSADGADSGGLRPSSAAASSGAKSKRRLQMTTGTSPELIGGGSTRRPASAGSRRASDAEVEENTAVWAAARAAAAKADGGGGGGATPPPRALLTPLQKEAAASTRAFSTAT